MTLTKLQTTVQQCLAAGKSVLLVAPTGIGKTLAVTADLSDRRTRTVYSVPLRALASSILEEVRSLARGGKQIRAVVHHGDVQDSWLFSEEVAVTTYDQIVCAVPGLPLSLPMSAGHAIAGALLMSRLVLDEAHLAWGIAPEALTILLGILEFRQNLGLQTILMTATMPKNVAKLISDSLGMSLIYAGDDETREDVALIARKQNRHVMISQMSVKEQKADGKEVDLRQLADVLRKQAGKRIYFANTVERLQRMYDLFEMSDFELNQITVLHNRMPRSWRARAEETVRQRFGKNGSDGNWLLLTNQVAEAGLDISGRFVLSDPAPVATLVQRAGRCARWFRNGRTDGKFIVVTPPNAKLKDWSLPYRETPVAVALSKLKSLIGTHGERVLDWGIEQDWIDQAWSGDKQKGDKQKGDKQKDSAEHVKESLQKTTFALHLFDRASQQRSPGVIASAFREILSIQVAVLDDEKTDDELLGKLKSGQVLDSSATSLGRGYSLMKGARRQARVVRYRDELVIEKNPSYLASGDLLLLPPSVAYLDTAKGLCFGDGAQAKDAILESEFVLKPQKPKTYSNQSRCQSLWKHTEGVMNRVQEKLLEAGDYRLTLRRILARLEPQKDAETLTNLIGSLAVLATGFHDLGKCGRRWQRRAHEIDPACLEELIGRTANTAKSMGVPHTPPGFFAAVAAGKAALGNVPEADHLVRAIALAVARHHSSLLDPSCVHDYYFDPVDASAGFVSRVLEELHLNIDAARILDAARAGGKAGDVPLMLPNDDLFPIYALVGRAILISDREDAAGQTLEDWRSTQVA